MTLGDGTGGSGTLQVSTLTPNPSQGTTIFNFDGSTLKLTGANNYTGVTNVNAGTLLSATVTDAPLVFPLCLWREAILRAESGFGFPDSARLF